MWLVVFPPKLTVFEMWLIDFEKVFVVNAK